MEGGRERDGEIEENFGYRIYRTNGFKRVNKGFSQIINMNRKVITLKRKIWENTNSFLHIILNHQAGI